VSTGDPWSPVGELQAAPSAHAAAEIVRKIGSEDFIRVRPFYHAPSSYGRAVSPRFEITDADDPRLADYRALKERHLNAEGGRFVAESERVVRRLLASALPVHSVLATPPRVRALEDALAAPDATSPRADLPVADLPIYVAAQPVLDAIAGFHVHRGCLAIGERPATRALPPAARGVVVLEDLVDVDNLGAIARNAAAFGADALVLSPRCADPFYRKAIRVSLGAVFDLPIVRLGRWPDDLDILRKLGFSLVAAVLSPTATPLPRFRPPARWALLLGAEGPGLSSEAVLRCHHSVTIPMSTSTGADSLNVATAAAVMLYALTRAPGP
jgi:tRNA G18 (ribose-2'-O)-methylase SpoU